MKPTPELRSKINFLYYHTACNVALIAKHLGVSPATVEKHKGCRNDGPIPRPTERRSEL